MIDLAPDDIHWSVASGKHFILHSTIIGGVGLSTIGADRGTVGPSLLCRADIRGDRVVVTATNTEFGHCEGDIVAKSAVTASFAESVIAHCELTHETAFDPLPLAFFDYMRVARSLSDDKGASFMFDRSLSHIRKVNRFGEVVAIEAVLSFRPERLGPTPHVPNLHSPQEAPVSLGHPAPTDTVSVVQQVALWPLPADGYDSPAFDGTIGAMPGFVSHRFDLVHVRDARTPRATRFRLRPESTQNHAIVFYLDPAMPDFIKASARVGGNWWEEAFAKAGFPDCYRVEDLPDSVDLLDPRINVVLWIHRADRGWSWGMTQLDPRTGEIMRGIVRLGSQRIEQVRAIAESVLSPYSTDRVPELNDVVDRRMRQLAAHEIGHALGLAHNFASHQHSVPSVMDYPGPRFALGNNGEITADESYSSALGPWDFRQIEALYNPQKRELASERDTSLTYITDADSRLDDSDNSYSATWVAPGPATEALRDVLAVRQAALKNFGPGVVPPGSDSSEIAQRFSLLYMLHRYQVIATAKLVGGTCRRYAMTDAARFDGEQTEVSAEEQRVALDQLQELMTEEFVTIPARVRSLLVGPAGGLQTPSHTFTDPILHTFDSAIAMAAATDLVAGALLAPKRLNRVYSQSMNGSDFALLDVVDATLGKAVAMLNSAHPNEASEVIGWTIIRRFEHTIEATELHAHVRSALVELLEPNIRGDRSIVKRRLEAIGRGINQDADSIPPLPLGAPI